MNHPQLYPMSEYSINLASGMYSHGCCEDEDHSTGTVSKSNPFFLSVPYITHGGGDKSIREASVKSLRHSQLEKFCDKCLEHKWKLCKECRR